MLNPYKVHAKVRVVDNGLVGSVQRKPSAVDGKIMVRCVVDGRVLLLWRRPEGLVVI